MKFPVSKLKSHDLESLFRQSSIVDRHFFPRTVPSLYPKKNKVCPPLESQNKTALPHKKSQS